VEYATSNSRWNAIGWLSVALVGASIAMAFVDGVLGAFGLYAAMIVGGISGLGRHSRAGFGVATILASLFLGVIATHYTSSEGFLRLELERVWNAVSILGIPALISAALLSIGAWRRRDD
jgi:hypothetical protein